MLLLNTDHTPLLQVTLLGVGTSALDIIGATTVFVGVVMIAIEESVVKSVPGCLKRIL